MTEIGHSFWHILVESAPWLLLGLLVAGLVKALVPTSWMTRALGGRGVGAVLRAAVVGAPLPLCSCGVLPAAIGLRRQGASRGATVSFLVATPANGADSIAVSWALLGPLLTAARLISATLAAMVAGLLSETGEDPAPAPAPASSCSACCGQAAPAAESAPERTTIAGGIHYALTDVLGDIKLWFLIGLGAAAVVHATVPPDALARWGSGWSGMLVMLVVGLPMYLCATSSTPLAAAMLAAGVSPGAVVVFLLAGPATNAGTVFAIRAELGMRAVAGYLAGVCGVAVGAGLTLDALMASRGWQVATDDVHAHGILPHWIAVPCAILLILLMLRPKPTATPEPTPGHVEPA